MKGTVVLIEKLASVIPEDSPAQVKLAALKNDISFLELPESYSRNVKRLRDILDEIIPSWFWEVLSIWEDHF